MKVKDFLPHFQNEYQWSGNDCWPSFMVHRSAMWRLLFIHIVLNVNIRYKAKEYLVVAL